MAESQEYIELDEGLAIYKLKQSKNWYLYLWDKENKEAIRRSLRISNRIKAEHEARFLKMALERNLEGSLISKPSKLIKSIVKKFVSDFDKQRSEIVKLYEKNKSKNKKNVSSDNKYKELGRKINIYNNFMKKLGNINIKDLDYAHLKSFYNQYNKKVSQTDIRYMNLAVNQLLDYCLENRLIKSVPQLPKIKAKTGKTNKYFTQIDYDTIINKILNKKPKNRIAKENNQLLLQAFKFVTETGIRPGNELVKIQCSDLSVEKIQNRKYWVLQVKGGKRAEKDGVSRKIVISEKAVSYLKSIILNYNNDLVSSMSESFFISHIKQNKDQYLFLRNDGHTPDYTTLFGNLRNEIIDELLEKELVMYSCRHTFITNQLKRDANINVVAKHCGTSTDMINKHYNHLLSLMKPNELLENIYTVDDEVKYAPITDDMILRAGVKNRKEYLEHIAQMAEAEKNGECELDSTWVDEQVKLFPQ